MPNAVDPWERIVATAASMSIGQGALSYVTLWGQSWRDPETWFIIRESVKAIEAMPQRCHSRAAIQSVADVQLVIVALNLALQLNRTVGRIDFAAAKSAMMRDRPL